MKKRTRFTKKIKPSASPLQPTPQPAVTTSSNFYRSINDLPLERFEDCVLNSNLSALTISGFPEAKELEAAWENILQEYSEALGNSEYKLYVTLFRGVEEARLKWEMIKICLATLRRYYSPMFVTEVNTMLRSTLKFNPEVPESYLADIEKSERRSKALKVKYDLKVIEFKALEKKMTSDQGTKQDPNYFTDMLILLSKYNGYRISKDISVYNYCRYFKLCADESERVKKLSKK